jgi:hypothetical protein
MKKIIKRSYKRMTQDKTNSFANIVYHRMKDDAQFASLLASVTAVNTANEAFEVADGNAADGGRKLTMIKNDCLKTLLDRLDDVADGVEFMAKGDEKSVAEQKVSDISTEISAFLYVYTLGNKQPLINSINGSVLPFMDAEAKAALIGFLTV